MTITVSTPLDGGTLESGFNFVGYLIEEDIEDSTNINVQQAISADLTERIDDSFAAWAYWCAYVSVKEFNAAFIPSFIGNPGRRKLGSLTYQQGTVVNSFHFINFLDQGFPNQGCMVLPNFQNIPTRIADIAPEVIVDRIYPVINPLFGGLTNGYNPNSLKRELSSLYGSTDVRLYLEETVKANLIIAYYAQSTHLNSVSGTIGLFNI